MERINYARFRKFEMKNLYFGKIKVNNLGYINYLCFMYICKLLYN